MANGDMRSVGSHKQHDAACLGREELNSSRPKMGFACDEKNHKSVIIGYN